MKTFTNTKHYYTTLMIQFQSLSDTLSLKAPHGSSVKMLQPSVDTKTPGEL